jgi:hypothetical protein
MSQLDRDSELSRALGTVGEALRELHFGTITIVVHDGAIVQIDRTEKLRVPRSPVPGAARDR